MAGSKQTVNPASKTGKGSVHAFMQRLKTVALFAALLTLPAVWAQPVVEQATPQPQAQLLEMQTGELQVLKVPDASRIVVGNSRPVNVVTTAEKDVIVFAREPGQTQVQVWSEHGEQFRWQVHVTQAGAKQTRQALQDLMARMPNVRVSAVGDRLVVDGQDIADADRARLTVLAQQYPQILDLTSQQDGSRMVLLDVQVVEIPRSRLRELGLNWQTQSQGGITAGLAWDGGTRQWTQRPGTPTGSLSPMPIVQAVSSASTYLGINAILSAQIQTLAQHGEAVVLAQPQLVARSGATAEFLAGGEVPYSTTDRQGNVNTEFKPYGVSLRITPQVAHSDTVRSHIEVEVSAIDTAISSPNGPALRTRRASTEFNARSGQTLVLAGFVSRERSRYTNQVPGLGDIPLLGWLFRADRNKKDDVELAIFVTPVVVSAEHPDLQQRVQRGTQLMQTAFGGETILNVPVQHAAPLPPPVPDPFVSAATMVSTALPVAFASGPDAATDASVPMPRRIGANVLRFRD